MPGSIDSIIDRQLRRWELELRLGRDAGEAFERRPLQPLVTISRQVGTRGSEIAAGLAARLQYTLLDRDVIDRMCRSTGYTRRLVEALDERARSQITHWLDSMFAGDWVDSSDYMRALVKTIFSIAQLGGVVVVGRGANFIVGPTRGFHARIVAPRERRLERLGAERSLGRRDAEHELAAGDREREEFIRRLFGRSADDPLAYDVVVNEADVETERIVSWLETAARDKFARLAASAVPA